MDFEDRTERSIEAVQTRCSQLLDVVEMLATRLHDSERHEKTKFGVESFSDCTDPICSKVRALAEDCL